MQRGFSLVELSIVLVILGLLTGGILAGQSLIRASELRSVSTEYQRYRAAVNTFRDKYFALPGDMTNAQSFWGIAHATPATCITTASTTALTCNGNGDGMISPSTGSNEYFRFWQHLANAGLIEGSYDGITHGGSDWSAVLGTNAPRSKLGNTGWSLYYYATFPIANLNIFEGEYGSMMTLGAQMTDSHTYGAALKPEEAWNIDTKMDDGKPGKGLVRVREDFTTCHDAGTSAAVALSGTANYALNQTGNNCSLILPVL